jgi:hypothetical protein
MRSDPITRTGSLNRALLLAVLSVTQVPVLCVIH